VQVDDAAPRAVRAWAYTVGQNVVFSRGQYATGTMVGRRLLAHELAWASISRGRRDNVETRVMETPSSESEPVQMFFATTRADGRYGAMYFANDCDGNESEIRHKIADTKRYLASGAPMMKPGLSSRVYQEAFLAGLEEALEVIDEMTRRGEAEDLDLAFGRRQAEAEGVLDAWVFASRHWKDPAAIEAKIQADRLGAPIPVSSGRPMARVFSNYYTMGMLDGLRAALSVVKTLSSDC